MNLLHKYDRDYYIDLSPFYMVNDGWRFDTFPVVIKCLQKLRFFNRFDHDSLF